MIPQYKYFQVTIAVTGEPDSKGRQKTSKEVVLVDAPDVTGAEKKVMEEFANSMNDWEIVAVNLSKISEVY